MHYYRWAEWCGKNHVRQGVSASRGRSDSLCECRPDCQWSISSSTGIGCTASGRLVLTECSRLAKAHKNFAFESTLSGRTYLQFLTQWKAAGYRIEIVFLSLPSVQLALQRIATRVRQGGHDVPRADVIRRFDRSWENFHALYRPLAHAWAIYDNSGPAPQLLESVT